MIKRAIARTRTRDDLTDVEPNQEAHLVPQEGALAEKWPENPPIDDPTTLPPDVGDTEVRAP